MQSLPCNILHNKKIEFDFNLLIHTSPPRFCFYCCSSKTHSENYIMCEMDRQTEDT